MQTLSIYHVHTSYCGDCDVPMEDSIAKAIGHGFKRIGFSVHTPWPVDKPSRVTNANFLVYVEHAQRLKRIYADKIDVLCGIEGEYDSLHHQYFKDLSRIPGVDFVSFGLHYLDVPVGTKVVSRSKMTPDELNLYVEQWIAAMRTGIYLYAVHPDYYMLGHGVWDDDAAKIGERMIAASLEMGFALGYDMKYRYSASYRNGRGIPSAPFWRMAIAMGAEITVELDAHDLDNDWREMISQGEAELKAMGCKRVVTQFPVGGAKKEYREL